MSGAHYADDVLAVKPDMVVLMIGTNDVNCKVPLNEYRQNIEWLAAATQKAGSRMLMVTVPTLVGSFAKANETLYTFDNAIRGIARQYGYPVAEMHAAFDRDIAAGRR